MRSLIAGALLQLECSQKLYKRNSRHGVSVSVSFPIELETQNKGVSTRGTYLSNSDEEEIEIWCLSNPGL